MDSKPELPVPLGVVLAPEPAAPVVPGAPAKPDALRFASFDKSLRTPADRTAAIVAIAKKVMNLSNQRGGSPCVRSMPASGVVLVTQTAADTIDFVRVHPNAGQSRYRWEKQADGSEWGYKVEGADDAG